MGFRYICHDGPAAQLKFEIVGIDRRRIEWFGKNNKQFVGGNRHAGGTEVGRRRYHRWQIRIDDKSGLLYKGRHCIALGVYDAADLGGIGTRGHFSFYRQFSAPSCPGKLQRRERESIAVADGFNLWCARRIHADMCIEETQCQRRRLADAQLAAAQA